MPFNGFFKPLIDHCVREDVREDRVKEGQQQLAFIEAAPDMKAYEYAVLVTSLCEEVLTISQLYRDRADCENVFDEMKNLWGWSGFVTQDIKRCRLTARMIALVYNWWNLFVRLAVPDKHLEAITSRPLLLHGISKLSHHSGKQTLTITQCHGCRPTDVPVLYPVETNCAAVESHWVLVSGTE
jgi:hypothetical protein